jgi:hypothetical protein
MGGDSKQSNTALLELAHEAVRLADEEYQARASLETVMVLVAARQFEARVAMGGYRPVVPVPRFSPSLAPTRRWFEPSAPSPSLAPTRRWYMRFTHWFMRRF